MGKKILIVDDDIGTRKLISSILEKAGYDYVFTAETGEEAVERTKAEKPDIIILDVVLPDLSGYEVCRQVKTIEGVNCKIILITAEISDINSSEAQKAAPHYFLVKTPDYNSLVKAINHIA